VLVHNRRVANLQLNPAGNYDFLRTAELASEKNEMSVAGSDEAPSK
jgi:hypothetical protein